MVYDRGMFRVICEWIVGSLPSVCSLSLSVRQCMQRFIEDRISHLLMCVLSDPSEVRQISSDQVRSDGTMFSLPSGHNRGLSLLGQPLALLFGRSVSQSRSVKSRSVKSRSVCPSICHVFPFNITRCMSYDFLMIFPSHCLHSTVTIGSKTRTRLQLYIDIGI